MTATLPGSTASRSIERLLHGRGRHARRARPRRSGARRRPGAPTRAGVRSGAASASTLAARRHVRAGEPVADRELGAAGRAAVGQLLEHLVPVGVGPRAGGLGDVADDGHRAVERAAGEHAQLHRREVLRLVDHDVAVGADVLVGRLARTLRRAASGRAGRGPRRAAGRRRRVHVASSTRRGPRAVRARPARRRRASGPAARSMRAREPKRSWSSSAGVSTGHMRSSASRTSGALCSRSRTSCGLDRHPGAVGEGGVHARLDVPAPGVVEPEAALGVGDDGLALAGREAERLQRRSRRAACAAGAAGGRARPWPAPWPCAGRPSPGPWSGWSRPSMSSGSVPSSRSASTASSTPASPRLGSTCSM